jgi:hypothetical protein
MAQTRYADIASLLNNIYEGALFTLRQQNLLVPTVTVFRDTAGMMPRKNSQYGAASVRSLTEGEDVTSTQLTRTALSTLTPARFGDQFFVTDERIASDDHNIRADAALEMGAAFAQYVDQTISDQFTSLTGGTIGTAGSTLLWADMIEARAMMHTLKVPGPYYCALHPYQWMHLVKSAVASSGEVRGAPQFNDRIVQNYFVSTILADVTFVITPSIDVDVLDDAIGAMYNIQALAYDERTPFTIEVERDSSRGGWELNASLRYAVGTWAPARGIKLVGDAATPS